MLREIIISPTLNQGQTILPGMYAIDNAHNNILFSQYDFDRFKQTNKDAPTPVDISFNSTHRNLRYRYQDDAALQNAEDRRIQALVEVFWSSHPLLTINGKAHTNGFGTKAANYNLEDVTLKNMRGFIDWQRTLKVCNEITGMPKHRKIDVCCYYGVEPKGLSMEDIMLKLADFNSGYAVLDVDKDGNSLFLSTWGGSDNEERDYRVNCQKALYYNIIADRIDAGRHAYYLGDTFIGTHITDIHAWAKREDRLYQEHVVRKVKEEDAKLYGTVQDKQDEMEQYRVDRTPKAKMVQTVADTTHAPTPSVVTINDPDLNDELNRSPLNEANNGIGLPTEGAIADMDNVAIKEVISNLRAAGYGKSCTTDVLRMGGEGLKNVLRKIMSEKPEGELV